MRVHADLSFAAGGRIICTRILILCHWCGVHGLKTINGKYHFPSPHARSTSHDHDDDCDFHVISGDRPHRRRFLRQLPGQGGRSRNLRPVGGFSDRQAFRVLEDTLKCSYTH